MTDRAFEPAANDNPFQQFDPDKVGTLGPQVEPDIKTNPFAQHNPFPEEDPRPAAPKVSTFGAVTRAIGRSVLPALGSLPAMGAGAEAGATIGAFGGPLAGITVPVGTVVGALAGGWFGAETVHAAQNWALSKLPDTWRESIGADDRQERLDQAQHPTASFIGGLVPYAMTMRPGAFSTVTLPENATAFQRIMANPVTARVFSGGLMGGMELGNEAIQGESPDWTKVAISTGFGLVFNKPTRLGESIIERGARPTRALLGRPEPVVEAPAPAAAPGEAQTPEGAPAQPATTEAAPAPVSVRYRPDLFHEPTVAQAADVKVVGPGVTEEVFLGDHEQSPSAAMTAQDTARTEQTVLGRPPSEPDVHDIARRVDPETFAKYDELEKRRATLEGMDESLLDNTIGPGAAEARARRLAEVNQEIEQVAPQVAAAYRRAAEATGAPAVEPEQAPVASDTAAVESQRAAIAADVERQLVAAGRPAEEANAAAKLIAARYVARSQWFRGALGTPQELYAREGAAIRAGRGAGPLATRAEPQAPPLAPAAAESLPPPEPVTTRGPRTVAPEKQSLLQFLAARGGIRSDEVLASDLRSIVGSRNKFVPGFGMLIRDPRQLSTAERRSGRGAPMSLDQAREAAVEAGYIHDAGDVTGGTSETTIRTLLDAVDKEMRGDKQYRAGVRREAKPDQDAYRHEVTQHAENYFDEVGLKSADLPPDVHERMLDMMQHQGLDPGVAHERAVMEMDEHAIEEGKAPDRDLYIPGWDVPHDAGAAPGAGAPVEAGEPGPREGARTDRAGAGSLAEEDAREFAREYFQRRERERKGLPGQLDLEGTARITDAELAQRKANEALKATKEQKPLDFGLFGDTALQKELFQRQEQTDTPEFQQWFKDSKIVDEQGNPVVMYRGDFRPTGPKFRKSKTTSARFYFTTDPEVASNYAVGKPYYDESKQDFGDWFTFPPAKGERRRPNLTQAWYRLSDAEREKVKDTLLRATKDDDGEIAFKDEPDGGIASRDHWDYEVRQARGNWLAAAKEVWLSSAAIFGEEEKFKTILDHAGLKAEYDNPHEGHPVVTPVYLSVKNPIDTRSITKEFVEQLAQEIKGDRTRQKTGLTNWDKEGVTPREWLQNLREDYNVKGSPTANLSDSHVWTAVPERITEALQRMGFDGIDDRGGKAAGPAGLADAERHRVVVAFEPEQIKSAIGNRGSFDPDDPNVLRQAARGKILLRPNERPIITLMKDANASTFIHETGHDFLEQLMRDAQHPEAPPQLRDDATTVTDWLGVKSAEDIKRRQHEKFARGFEQYVREGIAPSPELAGVFAKFKSWLVNIYQTLKGLGQPISDDIRRVFDRMLAAEPQRTVIAPERARGPTLSEIHEADAAETHPSEAHAALDLVSTEKQHYLNDLAPEVRNELETALATAEPQPEGGAAAPSAELGGETPGSPSGPGEVVEGRSGPEPVPTGGRSGGEPGAVVEGRSEPRAESSRASGESGAETGSRPSQTARDEPLAPGPANLFGARESPFLDKAGNIRVDNLTTREDVAQAIRDAAVENDDFIGDRRGVITDGQVLELADALGMDAAKLNERKLGQAFNAEQIVAARKLLIQSATDVSAAMKKAAIGTDEDVMAYAQAKDRHQMIQAHVAGITAEAGRALRAFRSLAGQETAQGVDQFLRQATGKTLFQLREEAKLGAQLESPQQVSKFMQDATKRTFGRMILEYWINGLISGPATHTTYMVGNLILSLEKAVPETATAAAIGAVRRALGREGETVRLGEVAAQLRAGATNIAPAMKAAVQAFESGVTTLLPGETPRTMPLQPGSELAKPALMDEAAKFSDVMQASFGLVRGMWDGITSGAALLQAGGVEGSSLLGTRYSQLGSIPDITLRGVNVLPIGTAVRLPGRFIAAIHSLFRSMNYSMDKAALAYRTASEEGLTGTAFDARVGDIRQNPSADLMEQARYGATELTLMGQGSAFTKALSRLTNTEILGFPFLKFIDPFVHISGNIIEQSIIQRTPVGILAPEIRADLMGRNGPVAQDTAQARMLVGTALSLAFGSLAAQGYASGSGPKDPKEAAMWRLAGNQAHSVRIGDVWYDMHRLGPMGMLLSIAADMYDVAHHYETSGLTEAAAHFQHAVTQNILDESFMRGPADLIKAIEDPGRYGGAYVRNFLAAFIPYSVGMAQMARAADPYSRQTRTIVDAIKAKVPGLSSTLLPRRDIWGEPIPNKDVLGLPGVSAIYAQHISNDPVNAAMLDLGIYPAQVTRKIRNVDLTDEQYDDFARIAGRMTKQRLDVIVRSPDYNTWPNHVKHDVIQETIRQSREAARGVLMMKYPQIIQDAVEAIRQKHED